MLPRLVAGESTLTRIVVRPRPDNSYDNSNQQVVSKLLLRMPNLEVIQNDFYMKILEMTKNKYNIVEIICDNQ